MIANRVELQTAIGEVIPLMQTNEGQLMIEHQELIRVVNRRKIKVHAQPPTIIQLASGGLEVVFQVIMEDPGTGRMAVGIGESNPATLETDISRNFPAKIAYNRAYDNAVIQILELPGRTYSTEEVNRSNRMRQVEDPDMDYTFDPRTQALQTLPRSTVQGEQEAVPQTGGASMQDIMGERPAFSQGNRQNAAAKKPAGNTAAKKTKKAAAQTAAAAPGQDQAVSSAAAAAMAEDEVILFGNFRGKTLAEARKNKNFKVFMNYITQNQGMTFPDEARQTQLNKLREMAKAV